MCYVFFCSLLSSSLSNDGDVGSRRRLLVRETEAGCEVQPDGRWQRHPPLQPPPSLPLLYIFIFYFLSLARCCLSSLQYILSSHPPPSHPPPILSPTHCHKLTHTHSFNLSTPFTPSIISIFASPPCAAGSSQRAVTYPIAALTQAHAWRTDRCEDRRAARKPSAPDRYLYLRLTGLIRLLSPAQSATVATKSWNEQIHTA